MSDALSSQFSLLSQREIFIHRFPQSLVLGNISGIPCQQFCIQQLEE